MEFERKVRVFLPCRGKDIPPWGTADVAVANKKYMYHEYQTPFLIMFFPILPEFSVFCKNQKVSGGKGGHFFSASTEKNTCCGYFLKFYKFYANQM